MAKPSLSMQVSNTKQFVMSCPSSASITFTLPESALIFMDSAVIRSQLNWLIISFCTLGIKLVPF